VVLIILFEMKLDAILTPAELPMLAKRDLRDTVCVVFDVLRATSTFVTALHNGAKAIVPVSEIAEAVAIRKKQPDALLAGERDGIRIRAVQTGGIDFDLGNSPREYTPEKVRGKTIVSTTTNGTRALRACVGAKTVLAASFLDLTATAQFVAKLQPGQVLFVCAGTRENAALEDVLAAGAMAEMLATSGGAGILASECQARQHAGKMPALPVEPQSPDAHGVTRPAWSDSVEIARRVYTQAKSDLAAAVRTSENAQRLRAIPELRDDLPFCLQRDIFLLVAKLHADGAIRPV